MGKLYLLSICAYRVGCVVVVVVVAAGVLSVGDVQRDVRARLGGRDARGALRAHEARTLRRHGRLHRLLGRRPGRHGRPLLRPTGVRRPDPRQPPAPTAALSQRHDGLPRGQLQLRQRYTGDRHLL